jgi:hypothetical protein
VDDRGVYCVWIADAKRSYLTVLDRKTLAALQTSALEGVHDPHSIAAVDGWIYIAATGTDEVRRVEARRPERPSELVWRASPEGRDTHHVNSILSVDRRLLCSAFGPKSGTHWSTALSGYVVDMTTGDVLWHDIEHPHSLARGTDDLYIAESRRARVKGLTTGCVLEVDGYARGLAFGPDRAVVTGSSRGRARSRSLGTIENPADAGDLSGQVGLVLLRQTAGGFSREAAFDLSAFEAEVYDIAILV